MQRKILFTFSIIAVLMCLLALSVSAMSGSGTESDPYVVENADDFVSIQNNLSAHYKLNANISVSSSTGAIVEGTFSGVFDGNGHTITVNINAPTNTSDKTYDALFGKVTGTIKNLTTKGEVCGSNRVSGIVGELSGSGRIENCVNYVNLYGRKNVGGIAGVSLSSSNKIINCVNFGNLCAKKVDKGVDMGGIIGCIWGTNASSVVIENCYNAGTVSGEVGQTAENCGGICGYFYAGRAVNCFNSGEITASSTNYEGAIFGKTENGQTHCIDGYFSLTGDKLIGSKQGNVTINGGNALESTGVAIYLGQGSGIRGEFHLNESVFNAFCALSGYTGEYGTLVSTKAVLESVGGDLLSNDAKNNDKIIFAPAMKNGEKLYYYVDTSMGDGYHSYRFALTGFPNTSDAYNTEFVILGYVFLTNEKGEQILFTTNTVESDRLASAVGDTGFNAVSIVRVAEATLEDGDFNGNDIALSTLNHIVSFKNFENRIQIDGTAGYGHKNATFTKSIGSDDTIVFKISSTDNAEFIRFIYDLMESGYEKVLENVIGANSFYTLKKGDFLVNATFANSKNEVIITTESITSLPTNITPPAYNKVTTSSITQIKLEASILEGMSYVIRLEDGSFLIIDGGWCDDNYMEADKLYNQLVALAGEGNDIVIAGWIFTHCHGDHIGTFNLFVEKYYNKVTIKQLLYNFPSDEDIANSGSSYMLDNTKQRYQNFKHVIATYLQDTEIVKLHSGYKFYYADAEIEILQTLEDLYPSTVANYDFNSSSTIFTVTVAGQKMLFLGDVSDVGASRLNSVYGTSLKSDFLQVAHHGLNNGGTIKNLYLNADATYILYPAPLSWYSSNSGASANFYLSTESKTVKQLFVSGAQTVELYLPYDGKLYDGEKLPNIEVEEPSDERVEISRPNEPVDVPDAYFDLDISGGSVVDAMGNATVTVTGGGITETTVEHNGIKGTTNTFTGDRYKEQYYMTLSFDKITSDSQWGDFVMGSSTFEIFLRLDKLPGQTVGLITSCNSGGTTLYLRKQAGGQLTFQIGSTKPNSNGTGAYSSTSDMNGSAPLAFAGDWLHIVGSYDNSTNTMKLYINGILVASADYGTGSFKGGADKDYIIGIGYNPQYSGEALSSYANYELFEAKIYNTALTDDQVAQEYWNCIDNLFETEAGNE